MNLSDLPPGVSPLNPHINPDDSGWDRLYEQVAKDTEKEGMTDMDAFVAWRLGLAAFTQARKLGVKWPHD